MPVEPSQRSGSWAAHLVAGGTRAWHEYAEQSSVGRDGWHGPVPGAQNLELLRRLNLRGRPSAESVREVLTAALPGRGRPDLLLRGADEPRWGHPPIDPVELAPDELVRVAGSVLAGRIAASRTPSPQPHRIRRWSKQYVLHGDPWWLDEAAERLVADGRPSGGPAAHHLVLAAPLDQLLLSLWSRRSFGDGVGGLTEWLGTRHQTGYVPARIDLVQLAERAASRVGVHRTHVVLDPAALPGLTGMRRLPAPLPRPGWAGTELARRIGAILGTRVAPERRRELVWQVLRPALRARPGIGRPRLRVPERHRAWLIERAEAMIVGIRRRGYPVHGDLDTLVPGPVGLPDGRQGDPTVLLDLALDLILDENWPGRVAEDREVNA